VVLIERNNLLEEALVLVSLDATAQGGDGEVVRSDAELEHGLQDLPGLAHVGGSDEAVDDGVLAHDGEGESALVHQVEYFLHLRDLAPLGAAVEHHVEDGLVEVEELFGDLAQHADRVLYQAHPAHSFHEGLVGLLV